MGKYETEFLPPLLRDATRSLTACRDGIPRGSQAQALVDDAMAAQARGYFTPQEDERLRTAYSHYLGIRVALWQTVQSLLPYIDLPTKVPGRVGKAKRQINWQAQLQAFAIAFAGTSLLLRSGYTLIDMAADRPVVRDKLDEAEPRYGITRKQFTAIYDSLTSSRRMVLYYGALRFYHRHRSGIYNALSGTYADVAEILKAEEPYFETRRRDHIKRKANFNVFALRRRRLSAVAKTMFFLFEAVGSDIAELKQPLVKPLGAGKRVTPAIRSELLALVKPGDVFVTRHDDAMSNLFLPGFWPHAALYIGTDAQRAALGIEASQQNCQSMPGQVRFLESKKDGVLFRPAEDTLQIDACVIIRPKLSSKDLRSALNRALSHAGKLYDFVFDFASADRLACTELIYRAYNGFGDIDFKLTERAARQCLSAEDLLDQAVGKAWFDVVALYGVGDNEMSYNQDAHDRLLRSYDYKGAHNPRDEPSLETD